MAVAPSVKTSARTPIITHHAQIRSGQIGGRFAADLALADQR